MSGFDFSVNMKYLFVVLNNFLVLAGIAAAAFVVTVCFWNRKKWGNDFSEWWQAEGFPIWAIVGLVLVVIALARGCFHHV